MIKQAIDIEIGDVVVLPGEEPQKVEGSFLSARGKVCLLLSNRWRIRSAHEKLEVL